MFETPRRCHIMMCGTNAHGKVRDALRNGGCACIFDWFKPYVCATLLRCDPLLPGFCRLSFQEHPQALQRRARLHKHERQVGQGKRPQDRQASSLVWYQKSQFNTDQTLPTIGASQGRYLCQASAGSAEEGEGRATVGLSHMHLPQCLWYD